MNKTKIQLMVSNGALTTHLTRHEKPMNWGRVVMVGLALAVIVLVVWR